MTQKLTYLFQHHESDSISQPYDKIFAIDSKSPCGGFRGRDKSAIWKIGHLNAPITSLALLLCALIFIIAGCGIGPTPGAFYRVESQQCTACGACTRVCNADAIRIISNKAVIDPSKCIQCGKCVETCPENAIW